MKKKLLHFPGMSQSGDPQRQRLLLVRLSGELSIKAKGTRTHFTRRLAKNLTDALKSAGLPFELRRTWSRIFIESASDEVAEWARRVFGVSSVSPVVHRRWESFEELVRCGEEIFSPGVAGKTFAVRARRSQRDKIPFRSAELDRELGTRLLPYSAGVDLSQPQFVASVEVHPREAYFFSEIIAGSGGLPIGVGGEAVALVSGGFDSVVAAWLMLRRGVVLDYVFCNLGGTSHRDEALRVMKVISDGWSFGYRPRIHVVDFRPLVEELQDRCPPYLWQVVIKRQMVRAAEQVARIVGAVGIVTGEAVGQVSSQTLQNLVVISDATTVPILRPLAGANKEEIVDYARRIGSYELSARVPEYCALVRRRPATHATVEQVERAETDLDPGRLAQLVADRANIDLRALDLDKTSAPELELESIPEGAAIIDLRSPLAFNSWHYPGARRLGYFEALKAYPSFDRHRTYLFYCEIGLKSAHLAEVMHEAGFRAYHFKGGLKHLLRYVEGQDPALRALMSPALLTE